MLLTQRQRIRLPDGSLELAIWFANWVMTYTDNITI